MPSSDRPSAALLAANARLAQLRAAQAQSQRKPANAFSRDARLENGKTAVPSPSSLPSHLGWGSAAVSNHLRQAERQKKHRGRAAEENAGWRGRYSVSHSHSTNAPNPTATNTNKAVQTPQPFIKLYPDIALGMLRREQAAPGRIWLLLRHIDALGRGWIDVAQARALLTGKASSLRVCGWRQLRNLLKQGQGVFWQRDKERIWLRSAAKTAYALGVTQLTGRPVGLPASALVGGIGTVRAHLYASFHSGRMKEKAQGNQVMPIARDTLTAVSGVGRASQRAYEACTRTEVQHNFAVGEAVGEENRERRAWRQGQALFELQDYRGEQGRKGRTYLAWQLPNTYFGRHQQRPKGRQKRINRELKDLVMKGMPGTVEEMRAKRETLETPLAKRYYPNAKLAAKAHGRTLGRQMYWPRYRTRNGRFDLWQGLGEM